MTDILVVNNSALLQPEQIVPVIAALNLQISRDFVPFWNAPGTLHFGSASDGAWKFYLQDTIDQQNDLGYHVDENGIVSAIIDIAACRDAGIAWETCLGHEVLEALADPTTERMAPNGSDIVEVCDPVEQQTYPIDGVPAPNFVTPKYFGWVGERYDFMGKLDDAAPALAPGGYIMYLRDNQWQTTYGEHPGYMALRRGGRREWRKRRK